MIPEFFLIFGTIAVSDPVFKNLVMQARDAEPQDVSTVFY
jgi:hypothetical protein